MKQNRKSLLDQQLERNRAAMARAVELAGGSQQHLADSLNVSQAAVSKWLLRGWMPPARAREVEMLFGVSRTTLADPRLVDALVTESLV